MTVMSDNSTHDYHPITNPDGYDCIEQDALEDERFDNWIADSTELQLSDQ